MNLNDYKNDVLGIDILRLVDDVMKKHKGNYNLEKPWIQNVVALEGTDFALQIISTLTKHRQATVLNPFWNSINSIEPMEATPPA